MNFSQKSQVEGKTKTKRDQNIDDIVRDIKSLAEDVQVNEDNIGNNLANTTGWGNYVDDQFDSGNHFLMIADTDTILPNNSGAGTIESQVPSDVSSFITVVPNSESGIGYDHSKINGRNGDGIMITIDLKAIPTSVNTTYIEFWFDIGGGVGELYRRIISFPKGNGALRPINFTVSGYTLDTWESNGATVYARTNGTCELYDVRCVVTRTHKARE